ncbi:MAG: OmpA family protein [Chromatiales bacterium]|jgi:OOP family OmpA-OmpF porin
MNKLHALFSTVLFGSLLVLSSQVLADDEKVPNYVKSSTGVIKNSAGECWRTPYSDSDKKLEECGYAKPEPKEVAVVETPEPAPTKVIEKITLAASMLFAFDSSELTDEAKAAIDERIYEVRSQGEAKLTSIMKIEGYTDSTGPEAYNMKLSERRAQAVADYILANTHRIKADEMEVIGMGESDPVATNDTREGRAQNRRVVVYAEGEITKTVE